MSLQRMNRRDEASPKLKLILLFIVVIVIIVAIWAVLTITAPNTNQSKIGIQDAEKPPAQAEPIGVTSKNCTPDWWCASWSPCDKNGLQTRLCGDLSPCTSERKNETRPCDLTRDCGGMNEPCCESGLNNNSILYDTCYKGICVTSWQKEIGESAGWLASLCKNWSEDTAEICEGDETCSNFGWSGLRDIVMDALEEELTEQYTTEEIEKEKKLYEDLLDLCKVYSQSVSILCGDDTQCAQIEWEKNEDTMSQLMYNEMTDNMMNP